MFERTCISYLWVVQLMILFFFSIISNVSIINMYCAILNGSVMPNSL